MARTTATDATRTEAGTADVEGPTDDPVIERLRNRQVKNFLTAVMLSGGVPMFVMGDEVRRSQRGNNNAYCQDNDTSWFDWNLLSKHADVLRFVKLLIERRVMRDVEHERRRVSLSQVLREHKTRLARRETQSAGLVVFLAQHRNRRGTERAKEYWRTSFSMRIGNLSSSNFRH